MQKSKCKMKEPLRGLKYYIVTPKFLILNFELILRRDGGMADARDLKSSRTPHGFEISRDLRTNP